ncbi:MAG: hypothetical protein K0S11_151 [Gammaproteobacteria bacterium]|jgi:MFS family permease|nr:hypothetical protein [Gammaproteobacteria bacterium]
MKKVTLITSIGAGLEYYDFVIYALLATYLSKNFFPQTDPSLALLQTFGIFAVGYIARPLGGVLFGLLGDRRGRKNTFLIAIILMAVATFTIGILPNYSQIGWIASLCLLSLRLIQGVAFGAELPGAITFLSEHTHHYNRGLHASFMVASLSLGATVGSLLIMLLTYLLTPTQMFVWGWRIPFLLGGVLAIIGYWLRRKTQETPHFMSYKQTNPHPVAIITTLLNYHRKSLCQGLGIMLFTACFIIFALGLPAYLHEYLGYELSEVYSANTLGLLWSTLVLPLFGLLSDRIGRKLQLIVTTLLFALTSPLLFQLLSLHHPIALIGFMLCYQTIIAATAACYIPLLAELFPTPVRYTGIALCYNIGGSLSGFTPLIVNSIMRYTGQTLWVVLFFSLLALITLVAAISLDYRHQGELS